MFNSNPFFFKGLLRGLGRAKKMQRCSQNCYPSASAVGVAHTFTGRTSALPAILKHYKGTTIFRNVIQNE